MWIGKMIADGKEVAGFFFFFKTFLGNYLGWTV
jgi:hypothetical protein